MWWDENAWVKVKSNFELLLLGKALQFWGHVNLISGVILIIFYQQAPPLPCPNYCMSSNIISKQRTNKNREQTYSSSIFWVNPEISQYLLKHERSHQHYLLIWDVWENFRNISCLQGYHVHKKFRCLPPLLNIVPVQNTPNIIGCEG